MCSDPNIFWGLQTHDEVWGTRKNWSKNVLKSFCEDKCFQTLFEVIFSTAFFLRTNSYVFTYKNIFTKNVRKKTYEKFLLKTRQTHTLKCFVSLWISLKIKTYVFCFSFGREIENLVRFSVDGTFSNEFHTLVHIDFFSHGVMFKIHILYVLVHISHALVHISYVYFILWTFKSKLY